MKEYIHTWNAYNKENKLCCLHCGITYNQYLQKENIKEDRCIK